MSCRSSVVPLLVAVLLLVPARAFAATATPTWRPDPWVTAKVKILLMTAEEVSAFNVNVDTVDGRVTLHGKVPTETEKARAESIATSVAGVVDVQNLLQVVPIDEVIPTAVRDDALRRSLTAAFDSAPKLQDSDIRVKSVNQGVVLLSGHADSLMEHLEAIRVAASVKGARRVATEVQTGDETYDMRLWRDAEHGVVERVAPSDAPETAERNEPPHTPAQQVIKDAADGGGPGMTDTHRLSDVMTDASITATIKSRLLQDASVPALSINVDTNNGVVTLFGKASNKQARKVAEAHARSVAGVVDVHNEIRIVDQETSAPRVTDDVLIREVQRTLEEREHLEGCNITVSANQGAIVLEGDVSRSELKGSAATIAASVPGVRSVDNRLQVRND